MSKKHIHSLLGYCCFIKGCLLLPESNSQCSNLKRSQYGKLTFFLFLFVDVIVYFLLFNSVLISFFRTNIGKSTVVVLGDIIYVIGGGVLGNIVTSTLTEGWSANFTFGVIMGVVFAACGALIREVYKNR